MAEIRSNLPSIAEYGREARQVDDDVRALIKDVAKDRTRAAELKRLDLSQLSPENRSLLSQMLSEQLRGQLPPGLSASLNQGTADPALLSQLTHRVANTASANPADRAAKADSPEAARAQAANPALPQQALRWSQFVQRATDVQGGGVQARAGSATPKGEGTVLAELIAAKLAGREGPGLRNPKLVARAIQDLSPQQRAVLMNAVFGKELAGTLRGIGISDPLMFVKAGALPSDRENLAKALNMPRGRLLGLLLRAEMLKIGTGRNGELAVRPELLGPLKEAGVAMLASLSAMRGLSFDEMKRVYDKLRNAAGGFKNAVKGSRVPVKRDLMHWARTAARRRSEILLADSEEYHGKMGRDDAMELVQAWYLENLLWDELHGRRRGQLESARRQVEREQRERKDRESSDQDDEDEGDDEGTWTDDSIPDLDYDDAREDRLMCFWISDPSSDPTSPGVRRMYVCIDPESGAIIPQHIEKEQVA